MIDALQAAKVRQRVIDQSRFAPPVPYRVERVDPPGYSLWRCGKLLATIDASTDTAAISLVVSHMTEIRDYEPAELHHCVDGKVRTFYRW